MAAKIDQRLEDVAEELTRRLGIPFQPTTKGTIAFRERLRVTDWAVPLMFDGHVAREDDALVPTGFVGHVLWPALRASQGEADERAWWYCTLTTAAADALVECLREDDDQAGDTDGWVVGEDVLLDEMYRSARPAARRRVA